MQRTFLGLHWKQNPVLTICPEAVITAQEEPGWFERLCGHRNRIVQYIGSVTSWDLVGAGMPLMLDIDTHLWLADTYMIMRARARRGEAVYGAPCERPECVVHTHGGECIRAEELY